MLHPALVIPQSTLSPPIFNLFEALAPQRIWIVDVPLTESIQTKSPLFVGRSFSSMTLVNDAYLGE